MTLRDLLTARIAENGPLTVAEYMAECLLHPRYGYYTTRDPFGQAGDFTTAPEISQMFGELIGLCMAQAWLDQGRPAPFTLAEAGPGRGTLMADILRATAGVPGFHEAASVTLFEVSEKLRALQTAALAPLRPVFADTLDALPVAPLFFVANEFFDALPIRQFVRAEKHWRERQVGLQDGALCFGLAPELPQPALSHRLEDTVPGDMVEYAPQAGPLAEAAGRRIADTGGLALIIDYGDWRSTGDTFQAVREHKKAGVFEEPGHADLTAHVDFEGLARAAPCAATQLTTQGTFLERLGITERARRLATRLSGTALEVHIAAHRRLTHPDEMGTLFKVLGLYRDADGPPPGLER
ncbi:class I SAM-dependent methyltransferase [Roseobacter ponti]|uniref:Class I SAM-dependent methyltransferase n=1 Tax=Roseobacter ponti TaxID=1891787 RepID=A0A858SWM6_9RHOB|nr:SAM-dependent methyltransferase [Roseobacter ponti]QJF52222.1 class I SAM-dependent methyltransferase [Roseobacter ponti]